MSLHGTAAFSAESLRHTIIVTEEGTVTAVFRSELVEKQNLVLDSEAATFIQAKCKILRFCRVKSTVIIMFWRLLEYIAPKLENVGQCFQVPILLLACHPEFYIKSSCTRVRELNQTLGLMRR